MEKKINKKIIILLRYTIVILCAAIFIAGTLYFVKSRSKNYSAPAPAVEIMQPAKRSISQSLTLYGHVEALKIVPVIPLVSGIITHYPVKVGVTVSEGEVLAIIDKAPFEQQVLEAKAAYRSYESTFKRIEKLYKANAATLQNFETVKAQRDSAKAQLELAKIQLGYAEVSAPIDGTILTAPLAKGDVGNPQQPVAIIADLSEQVVRLDIPEKYFELFNTITEKFSTSITQADMTGVPKRLSVPAVIHTISPYIQVESKTFQTVFKLTEKLDHFRPGMFVEITVTFKEYENVPALPLSVLKLDGSCYTFTPDKTEAEDTTKKGTVTWHKFPITVKDNHYFMVPENLSGKWFVASGQGNIFDKQTVTVTEKPSAETNNKKLIKP